MAAITGQAAPWQAPHEFAGPVAAELRQVEESLAQLLPPDLGGLAPVIYHQVVRAGGKRLRPLLVLLSCAAAGGDPARAITMATGVEVVHLASLMHDDVIDEARERRGRPAARQRWGNRASILVGDLLIAQAFRRLSDESGRAALGVIAEAVVQMCQSELTQRGEGRPFPDEAAYFASIQGKTAALMAAACEIGATAAGNTAAAQPLREFGANLGLAFQITDDLLDLYGEPAKLGKPVRQDLLRRQWTLPVIAALQSAPPEQARGLQKLLQHAAEGDAQAAAEAAARVEALGGREYASRRTAELVRQASLALAPLPETPARDALAELAEYVTRRES